VNPLQHGFARGVGHRRLVRRMGLSAHDAEVWLGMFKQILWKLGPH